MLTVTYSSLNAWISGHMCKCFNLLLRENRVEPRNEEDRDWIQEEAQKLLNAASMPLNTPATIYRGTCKKFICKSFKDSGLMSFSKDIEVAKHFARLRVQEQNSKPIVVQVYTNYGLDIDSFYEERYGDYEHNAQREIILPPSAFVQKSSRFEDEVEIIVCTVNPIPFRICELT